MNTPSRKAAALGLLALLIAGAMGRLFRPPDPVDPAGPPEAGGAPAGNLPPASFDEGGAHSSAPAEPAEPGAASGAARSDPQQGPPQERLELDHSGRDAVAKCLEPLPREPGAEEPRTPADVLAWVERAQARAQRPFQWEERSRVVHLLTSEGERRLRIAEEDEKRMRLRWFAVDAEGLPIALPVPAADEWNPSQATVDRYLARGRVTMDERERAGFGREGSGPGLNVVTRNGQVRSFEIWIEGRMLGCAPADDAGRATCNCVEN
ncbi:MAG: hypothetical protein IT285_11630 [Bdellovibrionales bacterium]|nr:hypothetical protein [Bdellovibrionales bacterium]